MNCPDCNVYMDLKSYNGFDVNWCYKCTGVWVEKENLLNMFGQTTLLPKFDEALNRVINDISEESRRKCPSCKDSFLKEFKFKNCTLDSCPDCYGIYFDSGELRKTFPHIRNSLQGVSDDDKLWNQTLEGERMMENNPFLNSLFRMLARLAG